MEFMDEHDEAMLEAVWAFNPYDLYSTVRAMMFPKWRC
jgi:hypothetical protein